MSQETYLLDILHILPLTCHALTTTRMRLIKLLPPPISYPHRPDDDRASHPDLYHERLMQSPNIYPTPLMHGCARLLTGGLPRLVWLGESQE